MDERGSSHGTGTSTAHGIVGALQLLQSFPLHRSGACAGCGRRPVASAQAAPSGLAGTQQALAPLAAQALLSAVATGWRGSRLSGRADVWQPAADQSPSR